MTTDASNNSMTTTNTTATTASETSCVRPDSLTLPINEDSKNGQAQINQQSSFVRELPTSDLLPDQHLTTPQLDVIHNSANIDQNQNLINENEKLQGMHGEKNVMFSLKKFKNAIFH